MTITVKPADVIVLPRKPAQITYDTQHTVTLSVQDWLEVLSAIVEARTYNEQNNWKATVDLRDELHALINAQVRQQIDAAGEYEDAQAEKESA